MLQNSIINKCKTKILFETCLKYSLYDYFLILWKKIPPKILQVIKNLAFLWKNKLGPILLYKPDSISSRFLFLLMQSPRCLHGCISLHNITLSMKLKSKDQVDKVVALKGFPLWFCCTYRNLLNLESLQFPR